MEGKARVARDRSIQKISVKKVLSSAAEITVASHVAWWTSTNKQVQSSAIPHLVQRLPLSKYLNSTTGY